MIKFVVNWGFNMQENMITYKIYKNVYDEMASGKKNVEIRLLNEKSQMEIRLHFKWWIVTYL